MCGPLGDRPHGRNTGVDASRPGDPVLLCGGSSPQAFLPLEGSGVHTQRPVALPEPASVSKHGFPSRDPYPALRPCLLCTNVFCVCVCVF